MGRRDWGFPEGSTSWVLPEGVGVPCWPGVVVSWLIFLLASRTGFSNWVFWLMWLRA